MADDLRTRIAKVLRAHWPSVGGCSDTNEDESPIDHLADAVIRELEADYILVPKGHTIARIRSAEKLGLTGDGE